MKTTIVLFSSFCVTVGAQQVPMSGVPQTTERQPVTLSTLAIAGEPVRSAKGWALTPDGPIDAEVPGLTSHGPGVRISGAAITVYRTEWALTGAFSVSATFQTSDPSATYGLTLGGQHGMAFLVRADGVFAQRSFSGGQTSAGAWTPVALLSSADDDANSARLEIRVGAGLARFVVEGQLVRTVPISPGQLDGVPGVHVDASGDVTVAGFTVQTAVSTPNVSKQ